MKRSRNRFKTYALVAILVVSATLAGGWLFSAAISKPVNQQSSKTSPKELVEQYFQQGLQQMTAKHYAQAAQTWQKLLLVNETMPEAHANLGFALYELKRYHPASEHFLRAMELNSYQANAYYGLAICLEQLGDMEGALGSMRSFVHLAGKDDPFLRKARSAIWEWETTLEQQRKSKQTTQDSEDSAQSG